MINDKFLKEYQTIYEQTKDNFRTEGYEINWIDEIYLPFWVCKQQIYVQTEIKPDSLSKILFQLVENGIKGKKDIGEFLGIREDDLILTQLDYLISNDYLEENISTDNLIYYELTHEGRDFFNDKSSERNIKETEVEYVVLEIEHITEEKYESFFNDLNQEFFNIHESIDSKVESKFSGYKAIETHILKKRNSAPNMIEHGKKPTLNKIKNSNFINFFNHHHHEHAFYDFNDSKPIEAHKRSIKFYLISYQNSDQDIKAEIRHCPETVNKFDKNHPVLEEKLTNSVKKYMQQNPDFVKGLKDWRESKAQPKL